MKIYMGIVSPPFRVVTVNGWSYPIALVCLVNAVHHSRVGYGSLFGRYEVRSKFPRMESRWGGGVAASQVNGCLGCRPEF